MRAPNDDDEYTMSDEYDHILIPSETIIELESRNDLDKLVSDFKIKDPSYYLE